MRLLVDRVVGRDVRALARAVSILERGGPPAHALAVELYPHGGGALVVGITGAPGSGKSTLVDALIRAVRSRGARVGVVAVDPSSPFSGGALLGDRVRMGDHAGDDGVFIRSMATRGRLGGLAPATADTLTALDAAGLDVIFVETVGVGQDEVDIMRLAAVTVLVLVPDAGDDVQANKAGVMEIADVFVVNKADRPDADRLVAAVEASLALSPRAAGDWRPPVLKTEATRGEGVGEVWQTVESCVAQAGEGRHAARYRARLEWRLRDAVAHLAVQHVADTTTPEQWDAALQQVDSRGLHPAAAARELLQRAFAHASGAPA
jgi:LAO/AO transport system kinase